MKWTLEQRQAIEYRGKNLLVAAGAGSGKTSVLVERIAKRIIDDDIDVDRLLVVTFTNAAAGEMRERIYSSIQDKLEECEDPRRLLRQQALLSKSHITTIHSFCQSLIRSNFIESGVISSFKVADENELLLLKEEVISDVLEKWYKKKNPNFLRLVETYSTGKNDNNFKDLILNLHSFILSFPWPFKWLDEQKNLLNPIHYNDYGQTIWGQESISYSQMAIKSYVSEINRALDLADNYGIDPYVISLTMDLEILEDIASGLEGASWQDAYNLFDPDIFKKLKPASKEKYGEEETDEVKKIRNKVKDDYLKLIKIIFSADEEAALEDLKGIYKDMRVLIYLVKHFYYELNKVKRDKQLIDFSDFEHMALDILVKKEGEKEVASDIALRLQEEFIEVYIDEYQDTNLIQEMILSLVSKDNNRFFVGDIKQSIYSFRQARPELFIDKYEEYKEESKKNKLVKLYSNFRSRENIINCVNYLFSRIMNKATGDLDYNLDEYLNFGAKYYDSSLDSSCELLLYSHNKESTADKQEMEAKMVARKIKGLIREGFKVYDTSTKEMRLASYRDFVILARSARANAESFKQVFNSEGIALYYEDRAGFFDSLEVNQLLAYLNIIDNPLQDIELLAVLRSSMYNFNDSELTLIKLHEKGPYFFDSLIAYQNDGDFDNLRDKIVDFLSDLALYRDLAGLYTSSQLIWEIANRTGFYAYAGLLENGEKRQANIRLLFERAASFDQGSNKGIFRFLRYMDELKKRDKDIEEGSPISEGMDVVRLMTIHGSKGLEFPIVFLIDSDKAFNKRDQSSRLVFHKELGLGPTCYLEEEKVIYPSILKGIIGRKIDQDSKAEEMRLLYVALTRAREKLIITGHVGKDEETIMNNAISSCDYATKKPLDYYIIESNTFLDWILSALAYREDDKANWQISFYGDDDIESMALSDFIVPIEKEEVYQDFDKESFDKVKGIFEWTYSYEDYSIIPSKLSVSDLKRYSQEDFGDSTGFEEGCQIKGLPDFLDEKLVDISQSRKGTLLHLCIQKIDFARAKALSKDEIGPYVRDLIQYLLDENFIKPLEAKAIEEDLLISFIGSNFFKDLLSADKIYRETPFTLIKDWKDIHHEGDREGQVSIQGIIDFIYEKDGKVYLVDFKSDYIEYDREKEIRRRYKEQIDLYKEAINKIMRRNLEKAYIYLLRYDELILM